MRITYDELREIKHKLPTGSIRRIATELDIDEQSVRNYFGAKKYDEGQIQPVHRQQGPQGGIVDIQDDTIMNMAMNILGQSN